MAVMRVIPIKVVAITSSAIAEEARVRLEGAGFMSMMALGEPRLSEFVASFKALGYDVELVPYTADDVDDQAACDAGSAPLENCATIYVRKRQPPLA